jgi:hypothetical protein
MISLSRLLIIVVCLALAYSHLGGVRAQTDTGNQTVPGELLTDPATLKCLAFRWFITGDANGNGTVTVSYRKQGETQWHESLPMLRVNREVVDREVHPFTSGNLFAGSVLNLEPGTSYEVRFKLSDPDGGFAEKTVTTRTRSIPSVPHGERTLHVYPEGFAGAKAAPNIDLRNAARQAQPGDVVLIHTGTYKGTLVPERSGTPEKPIVFRSAGDGEAILLGPGGKENVIEANGRDYLTFEGLTIRNGYTGIKANGAKGLNVSWCKIEDVSCGIITYTTDASGWYIADNTIMGRVKNWYPRVESSDTGISCCGSGHVICYNHVQKFWDCISTDNYGEPKPEWVTAIHPPQMAIDIYGNDCSEALDDGIEADACLHNIRVFENRIINIHTGLSAQPHLGGPLYFIRNVIYNATYAPFKLHNYPSGLVLYHNTAVSARQALEAWPPYWQNATFRNNLFLGTGRYTVETGSPHPSTTLDYDGYGKTSNPERFIAWSSDGKKFGHYRTLEEFHRATGHEAHGIMIDYNIFVKAAAPHEGQTYMPGEMDLRLRPGSAAIDAGIQIPTINESFKGRAPDLGCYEEGAPMLHYGPRPPR